MLPRRTLIRSLRLRNLALITIIVVCIYIIRSMVDTLDIEKSPVDQIIEVQELKQALLEPTVKYFIPESKMKIDWHNYKQIERDKRRKAIGEQGKPAYLSPEEKPLEDSLYAVNGFNGALSDKIALNRSLPDIRHPGCKDRLYYESLPTVSVVVPFHNEHWSTLLRTAYSVINRSPSHLMKEVFLVDDASTKDFLKGQLDKYLAVHLPKVKVVRLANRSGLITARLKGAQQATADVIVFLDSHTEANVNWLPPLLEPIAQNYRTVVCPFIDVIAYDTFEYRAQDEGARGGFDWEFFYKRLPLLPNDEQRMPEPFESPVMAGGLFAISRVFFWELGGYDPGLDIWGGEQYEISFKIWQCGGRMLDAPCSRVGHIYRKFAPFPNPNRGDFVGKNYRRVAEVWMDEYAQYLYKRRPHYLNIDPGDIRPQRALRERLKCKPFKWFITQVAFDLPGKYPPIEPPHYAEGRVRPVPDPHLCVDMRNGGQMEHLSIRKCSEGREIDFAFSWHKDIRSKMRTMCWDLPNSEPHSPVVLYSCHQGGGNQLWRYHHEKKIIKHSSGNCLDFDPYNMTVFCNHCKEDTKSQQWIIDKVDEKRLQSWDDVVDRVTGPIQDDY